MLNRRIAVGWRRFSLIAIFQEQPEAGAGTSL